jgi:hypothetical protein
VARLLLSMLASEVKQSSNLSLISDVPGPGMRRQNHSEFSTLWPHPGPRFYGRRLSLSNSSTIFAAMSDTQR